MEFDTKTAAGYAADKLEALLNRAERDTQAVVQSNDIPTTVTHYAQLRDAVEDLARKVSALKKHLDSLDYEDIGTPSGFPHNRD